MAQHEPTFKIFCRADEAHCLTIRHDAVVLAPTNPRDEYQHWYKDMRHSTRVKDAEGHPAFALVNRATGLAVKHSLGQSHPVKLVPYNADYLDESVLWTESNDVGKGFRCIRMVNNIHLNFDALNGDKDHGGVRDGTGVVLWEWCKGDNQSWKVLPWGAGGDGYVHPPPQPAYGGAGYGYGGGSSGGQDPYAPPPPAYGGGGTRRRRVRMEVENTVRVLCRAGEDYSLTVRNGAVCLAPTNPRDEFQENQINMIITRYFPMA
nr:ricin B-like lectin R40C1 [Lolium perenne]